MGSRRHTGLCCLKVCLIWALVVGAAPVALAQMGDRPDEVQRPPRQDIEIPASTVRSPEEEQRSFVLPPGFRIELVAAEPLVHDPVVIQFDSRGRLWVVELSAYNAEVLARLPVYLKGRKPPARPVGRVVILGDTNGDGRMVKRTVYADNLNVPRAVGFVGDQVLIGDPPNLWLTSGRNGTDKMSEKTLLANDYGTPSAAQYSANGLLWGRDNWLYNANYTARLRLRAGSWQREPLWPLGQWGITQDDFGRLFYNSNEDQLRGDFIPSRFAGALDHRIPLYGTNMQIATDQSTWPVRPTLGVNRGYRPGQLREDGTLATFTAACAPLIYRGVNFPSRFVGNAFVADPAGNLVKRNLLAESEGQLTALNAYHGVEFLTSSDERFRPVYLANGPDGALYVVDMYRGMIEDYAHITSYLRDQILKRDLNTPLWGLGRIWRVVSENGARAKIPDFAHADPPTLVKLLTDANGWTRDTAQRRIVESGGSEIVLLLRELLADATNPRDRVSAIWCLEGIGALSPGDVGRGLDDGDLHVRSAALQAGQSILRSPAGAPLIAKLGDRVATEEPMVLAQVALTLSGSTDNATLAVLWDLLPRAAEHPTLSDAVLVALNGHETETLERIRSAVAAPNGGTFGARPLLEKLATHIVVAGGPTEAALVGAIVDRSWPQWGRFALMRGATHVNGASLSEQSLAQLAENAPDASVRQQAAEAVGNIRRRLAGRGERPPLVPLSSAQQALFELGKTTFGICAGCHQPDGRGRPGIAPSLSEDRWANAVAPDAAIHIVLKGKEGTPDFPAGMVPLASLSDEQLAGVLTFVRRSFGNSANAVDPEQIASVRRAISGRVNPWTDAELEKLFPADK